MNISLTWVVFLSAMTNIYIVCKMEQKYFSVILSRSKMMNAVVSLCEIYLQLTFEPGHSSTAFNHFQCSECIVIIFLLGERAEMVQVCVSVWTCHPVGLFPLAEWQYGGTDCALCIITLVPQYLQYVFLSVAQPILAELMM